MFIMGEKERKGVGAVVISHCQAHPNGTDQTVPDRLCPRQFKGVNYYWSEFGRGGARLGSKGQNLSLKIFGFHQSKTLKLEQGPLYPEPGGLDEEAYGLDSGLNDCGLDCGLNDCGLDFGLNDCGLDCGLDDCGLDCGLNDCRLDRGLDDCGLDPAIVNQAMPGPGPLIYLEVKSVARSDHGPCLAT
jgi:hypothetical protein